jgi:hypothetical protein
MSHAARVMPVALCLCAALSAQSVNARETVEATYFSEAPTMDADLSEWDLTTFVHVDPDSGVFDAESGTTDDPADQSFSFGVANDDEYLYVAAIVVDDILVLDTNQNPSDKEARAWMDDAVEIFIDGDHSLSPDARDADGIEFLTGGEFSVVANGAVTSNMSGVPGKGGDAQYWTSAGSYGPPPGAAYQSPWDREPEGFVIEARFRFPIMGEGVGPGSTIGFTVSAHDDDDGGGRDTGLYWQGRSPSCWRDEGGWGDLLLALPAATPVEPASYGEVKRDSMR